MDVDLLWGSDRRRLGQSIASIPAIPILRTSEKTPSAPKQARSIEKRDKLLQTGRVLFGKTGYEATSIEEITSKAGTAAGAFYQYFSSKRQFLVVLMNELLRRLGTLDLRPTRTGDLRIGLREFLAAVFRSDFEYYGVVRAWQEAAFTDAELGEMQKEIERWTEARVLGVFRLLQEHPNARPNRDLQTFARMMDRHFWSLLARGSRMSPESLQREIQVAADVIFHYLLLDHRKKGRL
jgi:AcrR family transcriptional regulator